MEQNQRIKMIDKMRELRSKGRPEAAADLKVAFDRNEYTLGGTDPQPAELPNRPPTHGPGSGIAKWREYATLVSDFDEEIIESTQKKDLVLMLEAHDL